MIIRIIRYNNHVFALDADIAAIEDAKADLV